MQSKLAIQEHLENILEMSDTAQEHSRKLQFVYYSKHSQSDKCA